MFALRATSSSYVSSMFAVSATSSSPVSFMFAVRAISSSRVSFMFALRATSSSCVNATLHLRHTVGEVLFYFCFPEAQHNPTIVAQFDSVFKVTLHITFDFFVPIFYVGRYIVALHAFAVPELPVAKDSDFVFGNDNIRMAAAHLIILAIADAFVPQSLAQKDFDFGILAADGLHVFMALLLSQLVHLQITQI